MTDIIRSQADVEEQHGYLARPDEYGHSAAAGQPTPILNEAVRRHWFLILLTAIIFAGAGAAIGLIREPVYKAKVQLNVGQADLSTLSLPAFTQGAQSLASSYSRLVPTSAIMRPTARRLHIGLSDATSRVSASPIPGSTLFAVTGTGASAADAERFANVSADESVKYLSHLQASGNDRAVSAFNRFLAASHRLARYQAQVDKLKAADITGDRLAAARTRADAAQLMAQTAAASYQQTKQSDPKTFKGVFIVNRASSATSDRSSMAQRLGFVGLVAGLFIGLALAVLRTSRRRRAAFA